MDNATALEVLSALSQETRLEVFRLLVRHEPEGLMAGDIARALSAPHNTMSNHLAILTRAGVLTSERRSRAIVYRANLHALQDLTRYLIVDCCRGQPELCASLVAELKPCCQSNRAKKST